MVKKNLRVRQRREYENDETYGDGSSFVGFDVRFIQESG